MAVTPAEFLSRLASAFPDVEALIRPDDASRPSRVAAVFRRATEEAMDAGMVWAVERHFRFIEVMLWDADPEVREALEVKWTPFTRPKNRDRELPFCHL